MKRDESLVSADVSWIDLIEAHQCLVTWEVFGGGLMGNLLTDSSNVELSLWPDTKYRVQVTCKNKVRRTNIKFFNGLHQWEMCELTRETKRKKNFRERVFDGRNFFSWFCVFVLDKRTWIIFKKMKRVYNDVQGFIKMDRKVHHNSLFLYGRTDINAIVFCFVNKVKMETSFIILLRDGL